MKRFFFFIFSFALICKTPCYCEEIEDFEDSEIAYTGTCPSNGLCNGVGFSMMGWGIAFFIAITILGVVINQSLTAHFDSNSDVNSKSTESTGGQQNYDFNQNSPYGSII